MFLRKLTRRQFGQIAIAGSTAAAIAALTNRTLAQTPQLRIIGVRPSSITNNTNAAERTFAATNDVPSTDEAGTAPSRPTTPSTSRRLELVTLDISSKHVQTQTMTQPSQDGTTVSLQSGEEITGFAVLNDGTMVVAITPISTSDRGRNPTRLVRMGTSQAVTVSGLSSQELLDSLLVLNDGSLIGLVGQKSGTPPNRIVNINPQTGQISDRFYFSRDRRFSNLAQCSNGIIYTTTVAQDGTTSLVTLNLGQNQVTTGAQLRLDNRAWNNGLQSLTCSSAGQLFALGVLWHETTQYLYTVDVSTGNMTRLQNFGVAEITVSRT